MQKNSSPEDGCGSGSAPHAIEALDRLDGTTETRCVPVLMRAAILSAAMDRRSDLCEQLAHTGPPVAFSRFGLLSRAVLSDALDCVEFVVSRLPEWLLSCVASLAAGALRARAASSSPDLGPRRVAEGIKPCARLAFWLRQDAETSR